MACSPGRSVAGGLFFTLFLARPNARLSDVPRYPENVDSASVCLICNTESDELDDPLECEKVSQTLPKRTDAPSARRISQIAHNLFSQLYRPDPDLVSSVTNRTTGNVLIHRCMVYRMVNGFVLNARKRQKSKKGKIKVTWTVEMMNGM